VAVTRLGLIVRIDQHSGLAHQTQEMLRWLEPTAVLFVLMGDLARGIERYPEYDGGLCWSAGYRAAGATTQTDELAIRKFVDACDVVLAVETFYWPYLCIQAAQQGRELVLYANPELLNPAEHPEHAAHRYLWACDWQEEHPSVSGDVLEWPCSTDLFEGRRNAVGARSVPTFVHSVPDAMLFRDGTDTVEEAAGMVSKRCRFVIFHSGKHEKRDALHGMCDVEYRPRADDFRDLYADADCLLLPRKYGALSLPMLEAAAAGVPTLTTALSPQAGWFAAWPELLVPPGSSFSFPMKGNRAGIQVWQPSAGRLAQAIDLLVEDRSRLAQISREVLAWAEQRSWPRMLPRWREVLGISTAEPAAPADDFTFRVTSTADAASRDTTENE
jgi:hypothetical protein